jgi:hypothetical protein
MFYSDILLSFIVIWFLWYVQAEYVPRKPECVLEGRVRI